MPSSPDITELWGNFKNLVKKITYDKTEVDDKLSTKANNSLVSQSSNGLMSSTDKVKLDGIADGANKTVVDSTLSSSSTNPVQNKVVKAQLDSLNNNKANTNHTHNDVNLPLTRINNDWDGLPLWCYVKNGWCILFWEDPLTYLKTTGSLTKTGWLQLGYAPLPQTGRSVISLYTPNTANGRIQVNNNGKVQTFIGDLTKVTTYGELVYPTNNLGIWED